MQGALSGPLAALAARERQLIVLPLRAQAEALHRLWDTACEGGDAPLWAGLAPPADGQFFGAFRLQRPEHRRALCDTGLCLLRGEGGATRVHPLGEEARAALWAALLPLQALLAGPIHDEEPALSVALSVARAQRQGRALGELLLLLPKALPQEPALRGALLLRGLVIAYAADVPAELRSETLSSMLALMGPAYPVPLQWRALVVAELLLVGAPPAERATAFSRLTEQLPLALQAGASAAAGTVPLDEFLGTVLAGADAEEIPQSKARPYRRYAATLAYLLGALIAADPERLPELQRTLAGLPAEAAAVLWPALLGGLMTGGAVDPALEPMLLDQARSDETEARQEALRALARGRRAPDAEPGAISDAARAALSRGARDPVTSVRAAVAAALIASGAWAGPLLRRLVEDPMPEVRLAAAWSLLGRNEADEALLGELLEDVQKGGPEARAGAAMAAAALGSKEAAVADALAPLAATIQGATEPEWAGLRRFTSAAWPLAAMATDDGVRQAIYRRAAREPVWLHALGAALDTELGIFDDAPHEVINGLLAAAVTGLRDDTPPLRLRAARALGAFRGSDPRILDLLALNEPSHEVLQVLTAVVQGSDAIHPRWSSRLLGRLDDVVPELEAEDTPAELAMECLAELAAPTDETVRTALAQRVGGPQGDAAYSALCRLITRGLPLTALTEAL